MAPVPARTGSWLRWLLIAVGALLSIAVLYAFRGPITSLLAASPVTVVLASLLLGFGIAYRFGWTTNAADQAQEPQERQKKRDIVVTVLVLAAGLLVGLHIATAAGDFAPKLSQAAVMQIAIGWALGYFGIGFVTGFLFGIPRVLQGQGGRKSDQDSAGYEQRVNTNLEQISDWLTKIIVGLGLVELRAVPGKLHKAAQWMAQSFVPGTSPGVAPPEAATSFAGALIVFFTILGFLGGYLTTRLFLAGAFGRADRPQVVVEEKSFVRVGPQNTDDPDNARKLRDYWKPNEVVDPAHKAALDDWLKQKGRTDVTLGDLIIEAEHADLRKDAVAHFHL